MKPCKSGNSEFLAARKMDCRREITVINLIKGADPYMKAAAGERRLSSGSQMRMMLPTTIPIAVAYSNGESATIFCMLEAINSPAKPMVPATAKPGARSCKKPVTAIERDSNAETLGGAVSGDVASPFPRPFATHSG